MKWLDSSFAYCLRVAKEQQRRRGAKAHLHPTALPVLEFIDNYQSKYGVFPSVRRVSERFKIDPRQYYSSRDTLGSITDNLKKEKVINDIQIVQTSLQEMLSSGDDYSLSDLMVPLETLFASMVSTRSRRIYKLSEYRRIYKEYLSGHKIRRVANFGYPMLDKHTGGIGPSDYIVVYADTTQGKSTFARSIAGNIAAQGKRVLYITLEESGETSVIKTVGTLTRISATDVFDQKLSLPDERKMRKRMKKVLGDILFVDSMDSRTTAEIYQLIQHYDPVDVVILDQLSHFLPKGDFDWKVVNMVSKQCQAFAQNHQIPFIMLHQAKTGSKKAQRNDMAFGYGPMQDADISLYLHPDQESYNGTTLKKVTITKNRNRAKDISIDYHWDLKRGLIIEAVEDAGLDKPAIEVNESYEIRQ